MTFSEGQTVVLEVEFKDVDGALLDPDTVTLTYRNPNGSLGTPTPTRISIGLYRATVSANIVGIWRWRWSGVTGSANLVDEGSFCVEDSLVLA